MTSELERRCERTPKVTIDAVFGKAKVQRDDMAHNWRVTLRYQGRQLTLDFYGGDQVYNPSAADVVSSLILDAAAGEESFADFCADLGYDEDSRSAYRTWQACRQAGPKMRKLLGADFDDFARLEH